MERDEKIQATTCAQVRELLSDYLDVRRGEVPPQEASPLALSGVRAAVEQHLTGCATCRAELDTFEQIGAVYAEFNVGEKPLQSFTSFAAVARDRAKPAQASAEARSGRAVAVRSAEWRRWVTMVATSAAAAVLTVAFLLPYLNKPRQAPSVAKRETGAASTQPESPKKPDVKVPTPPETAAKDSPKIADVLAREGFRNLRHAAGGPFKQSPVGVETPGGWRELDPRNQSTEELLRQLEEMVHRNGQVAIGETPRAQPAQRSLLGLALKTLKDPLPGAPEGLCVHDVLKGGPADQIGLAPNDYVLTLNDLAFKDSRTPEVLKFFNAIAQLGAGEAVQIEYARWNGDGWVAKRGTAVLGKYAP
jgi:hypothetical protein